MSPLQRLSVISRIRRPPKLASINIVADKSKSAFDYDNDSIHVLKSGDNLTLSFTTDESVDETIASFGFDDRNGEPVLQDPPYRDRT